jgi:hypothetical protein
VFARSLPEAREAPLRQSIATITPQSANRDVIAVILVHVQVRVAQDRRDDDRSQRSAARREKLDPRRAPQC